VKSNSGWGTTGGRIDGSGWSGVRTGVLFALRYDHTAQQFQVEIPRKPIRRRFDIEIGTCRSCGRRVQGRHPLQTSDAVGAAASQLGPDAQAMTALLKTKAGVSYGDIRSIFQDFFGISLSCGGAAQTVLRVARRAEAAVLRPDIKRGAGAVERNCLSGPRGISGARIDAPFLFLRMGNSDRGAGRAALQSDVIS